MITHAWSLGEDVVLEETTRPQTPSAPGGSFSVNDHVIENRHAGLPVRSIPARRARTVRCVCPAMDHRAADRRSSCARQLAAQACRS